MSAHEHLEQAEQVEHVSQSGSKKIALFIAVLALFLTLSEMLGKGAQTSALTHNVNSNDLWSFFQSKTIRMALLSTAAEQMEIEAEHATDPAIKARFNKTIDTWKDTWRTMTMTLRPMKAASSSSSGPRSQSTSATKHARATINMNSPRPPCRSVLCWLRRK